jgi:hypothetical protein
MEDPREWTAFHPKACGSHLARLNVVNLKSTVATPTSALMICV